MNATAFAKPSTGAQWLIRDPDLAGVLTPHDYTERQRAIGEACRQFLEREVFPREAELETTNRELLKQLVAKAGEAGLLLAEIPEKYGGLGLDIADTLLLTELLGEAGGLGVTLSVQVGIGAIPLMYWAGEELAARYLPCIATGELVAAYALTEPESGSDALAAKTRAVLSDDGQHWIVNGTKQFITNGGFADVFTVFCHVEPPGLAEAGEPEALAKPPNPGSDAPGAADRTSDASRSGNSPHRGFSALLIERETPGLSVGPDEHKMGLHSSSTTPLRFVDCKVPVSNLIGRVGDGAPIALNTLNVGRLKLGVGSVGAAKRVFAQAVRYANQRRQFGRPIIEFGLIQHKVAEMAARLYACEALCCRTGGLVRDAMAQSGASGQAKLAALREFAVECAIAKVHGSEMNGYVADEAVQIHGGYGFIEDYPAARAYRDCRISRLYEGTNEINRLFIAEEILKRAAAGKLPLAEGLRPPTDAWIASPLDEVYQQVRDHKRAFAVVAGLVAQKLADRLDKLAAEQEYLGLLADVAIEIYALESALARALKGFSASTPAEAASTPNAPDIDLDLVRIYAVRAASVVWQATGEIVGALESAEQRQAVMLTLQPLLAKSPAGAVQRRRRVARFASGRDEAWL